MRLAITHETRYRYSPPVQTAQHVAHLQPANTPCQEVIGHWMQIEPEATVRHHIDAFFNHRAYWALTHPHDGLMVRAHSELDTHSLPTANASQRWEAVREHFRYRANAPFDPAAEFLFASPYVPRDDAFAAFARPAFKPGLPALAAAQALMELIHTDLTYETASTEVNTPALEALAQGKGVCQDFAHIMLGCLRSLGLPARYVSGYLLTRPAPGKVRLIGADASHAWVSVYVPIVSESDDETENTGAWFDFDPTNNRCGWGSPGEDYVTLATGRDFGDVSPMRGVIQSGADHTLQVAVTVAPPDELKALEAQASNAKV